MDSASQQAAGSREAMLSCRGLGQRLAPHREGEKEGAVLLATSLGVTPSVTLEVTLVGTVTPGEARVPPAGSCRGLRTVPLVPTPAGAPTSAQVS